MSMSGASAFSESQQSSTSGRSSSSGFSETSKKSKRQSDKKQKKKMRKKRQVKEGSPFEEDNLIELLKDEVHVTATDKAEVKDIMSALVYFGMIDLSTYLHGLVERLMKAKNICQGGLFSVEQNQLLVDQPDLQEYYFSDQLGNQKVEEEFKQASQEWENFKFFKH